MLLFKFRKQQEQWRSTVSGGGNHASTATSSTVVRKGLQGNQVFIAHRSVASCKIPFELEIRWFWSSRTLYGSDSLQFNVILIWRYLRTGCWREYLDTRGKKQQETGDHCLMKGCPVKHHEWHLRASGGIAVFMLNPGARSRWVVNATPLCAIQSFIIRTLHQII